MSLDDYRHPLAGFDMPVPAGWERIENPQDGVALVVVEPVGALGFRANVVVTVETLPDGHDLASWQSEVDRLLPTQLESYSLIDREHIEGGEREIVRRLTHHVVESAGSITMEQWSLASERYGYTLTASVATLAYDSLTDTFAEIATGFRIDEEARA